jgi:hypothetical protein
MDHGTWWPLEAGTAFGLQPPTTPCRILNSDKDLNMQERDFPLEPPASNTPAHTLF